MGEMAKTAKRFGSECAALDKLLGYHLRRLSVSVMADLTASLSGLGLKPVEASILFVIGSQPGITQSDIGKVLGILRANMTPLVAALITQGLVERKRADGRSHALSLSSAGQALARKASVATEAHEERVFGSLSRATRAHLIAQLRRLWQP